MKFNPEAGFDAVAPFEKVQDKEELNERFDVAFEKFVQTINPEMTLPEFLADFNACIESSTGKSVKDQIETTVTNEDKLIGEMKLRDEVIAEYQLYPGFFADFDTEKLKEVLF